MLYSPLNFEIKDDCLVIAITAEEKKVICKKYPQAHIVRTMKKDSKRHHYYMTEAGAPMRLLMSLRGEEAPKVGRRGV